MICFQATLMPSCLWGVKMYLEENQCFSTLTALSHSVTDHLFVSQAVQTEEQAEDLSVCSL